MTHCWRHWPHHLKLCLLAINLVLSMTSHTTYAAIELALRSLWTLHHVNECRFTSRLPQRTAMGSACSVPRLKYQAKQAKTYLYCYSGKWSHLTGFVAVGPRWSACRFLLEGLLMLPVRAILFPSLFMVSSRACSRTSPYSYGFCPKPSKTYNNISYLVSYVALRCPKSFKMPSES